MARIGDRPNTQPLSPFEKAAEDFYRAYPKENEAELKSLARKWLLSTTTAEEVEEICFFHFNNQNVGLNWKEFVDQWIEVAREWRDFKNLFSYEGYNDKESKRAFKKMLSLINNRDEMHMLWEENLCDNISPLEHEEIFSILFKKIHELPTEPAEA